MLVGLFDRESFWHVFFLAFEKVLGKSCMRKLLMRIGDFIDRKMPILIKIKMSQLFFFVKWKEAACGYKWQVLPLGNWPAFTYLTRSDSSVKAKNA